jgi:hypothetical protein
MAVIDGRTVKFADYVDETTLGETPVNPTMSAFPGELIDIEVTSGPEVESYNVLGGAGISDPLMSGKAIKTGETHQVKITVKANSLAWLPYILMGATTSTYAPGKVEHPVSIGVKADEEYCVYSGCVLTDIEFNFPDVKSTNMLVLTYMCIDKSNWRATDYIGTGAHGEPSGSSPYTMSSLSSMQYDAADPKYSDILIESLKIGISVETEGVTDQSSITPSKIVDYAFMSRSVQLDLGITLVAMSAHDELFSALDHAFMFTLDSKTLAFSGIKWTNNPAVKLAAASKVGMTCTSDGNSTRLTIT